MWMNEYDVADAARMADMTDAPNLIAAVGVLSRLVEWTNDNSDGWPYWSAPSKAARSLQLLVTEQVKLVRQGYYSSDIDHGDLALALRPVKAFLTRQASTPARITETDRNWILGA